jgi:acyl carrier protein
LDAIAQREDGVNGVRWVSIGWDAWQPSDSTLSMSINGTALDAAISEADGTVAFSRILASNAGPNILVSNTNFLDRFNKRSTATVLSKYHETIVEETDTARPKTDELIASTWCELLGLDKVNPEDDFFDLGGNSLLATQVATRLRRTFGIELSVQVLFEETTVNSLSRHVNALGPTDFQQLITTDP